MAVIEDRPRVAVATEPSTSFRPASRRRARILVGLLLAIVAIGGNVAIYSTLDRRSPVLQVVRDVPAGSVISADDLRAVDVAVDPSVRVIEASSRHLVVGQYARVRIVAGSLIVQEALQAEPLVGPDAAVVAVQVADGSLPVGLRERSQLVLVLPSARTEPGAEVTVVSARVVGLPVPSGATTGRVSLSVEVSRSEAAALAAADDVRVVLLEPGDDPAGQPEEQP